MIAFALIFEQFDLPNAPTWFYLSLLLAVALYFKFSRLLSVRNLDVLTLFLLVPGLLLLMDARGNWFGYLWLLLGSGYFLFRCLLDLTLVRRPALTPNLNFGGLAWLAAALFTCLVIVAYRRPREPAEKLAPGPAMLEHAQEMATDVVKNQPAVQQADGFDPALCVGRTLAVLCHLAIAAGLVFIGYRHFQDVHGGMAAATFYLLLPYTAYNIGQWHHVWPMALMVWAVALYRRPTFAGLLLGLAAGTSYFPALVFPLWCSFYWRRGAGRFTAAVALMAGLCLAVIGCILWSEGGLPPSLQSVLVFTSRPPWIEPRPGCASFWTGVHWAYCLPVFVAYVAFVCTTAFWPLPKNLAHLLALSAAVLIGIQFWYPDQGGIYVLWYLPLLLLLVFRPNLADRFPLPIHRDTDWLFRLGRAIARLGKRIVHLPEPAARVR
jgi:hypothetical protein